MFYVSKWWWLFIRHRGATTCLWNFIVSGYKFRYAQVERTTRTYPVSISMGRVLVSFFSVQLTNMLDNLAICGWTSSIIVIIHPAVWCNGAKLICARYFEKHDPSD